MLKTFFGRLTSYWWLALPLVFSPTHFAHAYVDPGSGSYAIQVIIGGLFGGAYALKSFGGRLFARWKKSPEPKKTIKKSVGKKNDRP